ncbi:hypothetical protein B296_00007671 [Ensete ventricosum]|uniref:CTP synthase N-terminal domain-containing protein n=1 Tax=Ensete ventricosum TaxID=4639 RepID=A0A427B2D1_ENSVE|nr:hypothetical protein B296_00007671 [Ensete ventricosum]
MSIVMLRHFVSVLLSSRWSNAVYPATYADPYLNTDAGTMSPFEHGEVFVLDDGGEVKIAVDVIVWSPESVINKERRGDYLGKTVQVWDIESMPFIEALGQFSYRVGEKKCKGTYLLKILFFPTAYFPILLYKRGLSSCFGQGPVTSVWFMLVSYQFLKQLGSR